MRHEAHSNRWLLYHSNLHLFVTFNIDLRTLCVALGIPLGSQFTMLVIYHFNDMVFNHFAVNNTSLGPSDVWHSNSESLRA